MPQLKDLSVQFISLVKTPATGKGLTLKSAKTGERPQTFTIAKTDDERMVAYGIVYAPDQEDSHGDTADAKTIRRAAYEFMREQRGQNIDTEHSFNPEVAYVAESWLVRSGDEYFADEPTGSWAVGIQIGDPDIWAQLKSGELTGLSLAGIARVEPDEPPQRYTEKGEAGWFKKFRNSLSLNVFKETPMDKDELREFMKEELKSALPDALKEAGLVKSDPPATPPGGGAAAADPNAAAAAPAAGAGAEPTIAEQVEAGIAKATQKLEKSFDDKLAKALAKGLIEPGDLTYGGVIPAQQASKIIDMVFDDPFLSLITTENMDRLQKSVDVLGAEGRQLVRIGEGAEPTDDDLASAYESGDQFNALPVQLFPSIKLSWLRANQHNPKLLQMLEQVFVKVMRRDFVDLGFNGIADTGAGATRTEKFLNLNKGWVQLAKDATNSPKIDIDAATDTWTETLANVRKAANDDYRSESVFVMSTADADDYARELGAHVTGTPLTADSPLRRLQGTRIVAHDKMPSGHVLFTPLYNLAFGLHNRIERTRQFHARKRVLEYTFDQATDYQIAVKQACVLGKPA